MASFTHFRDPDLDDFSFSEDESVLGSDEEEVATLLSSLSGPTNTAVVAQIEESKLEGAGSVTFLRDIEKRGGPLEFTKQNRLLVLLCDSKPSVYGKPRSALRRSTQNRLAYLKGLSVSEYLAVLRDNGRIQPSTTTVSRAEAEGVDWKEIFSSNKAVATTTAKKAATKKAATKKAVSVPKINKSQLVTPTPENAAGRSTNMQSSVSTMSDNNECEAGWPQHLKGVDYVPIEYDEDNPENHGGHFTIDTVPNQSATVGRVTEKTKVIKIIIVANLQDVVEGLVEAFLVGSNKVLLAMPSTPRCLRPEFSNSLVQQQSSHGQCAKDEADLRCVGMNAVAKDPKRKVRLFLVDFGNITLTNKHFAPDSRDGRLPSEFFPVQSVFTVPGFGALTTTECSLSYRVTELPQTDKIVNGQGGVSTNNMDMLSAMLQAKGGISGAGQSQGVANNQGFAGFGVASNTAGFGSPQGYGSPLPSMAPSAPFGGAFGAAVKSPQLGQQQQAGTTGAPQGVDPQLWANFLQHQMMQQKNQNGFQQPQFGQPSQFGQQNQNGFQQQQQFGQPTQFGQQNQDGFQQQQHGQPTQLSQQTSSTSEQGSEMSDSAGIGQNINGISNSNLMVELSQQRAIHQAQREEIARQEIARQEQERAQKQQMQAQEEERRRAELLQQQQANQRKMEQQLEERKQREMQAAQQRAAEQAKKKEADEKAIQEELHRQWLLAEQAKELEAQEKQMRFDEMVKRKQELQQFREQREAKAAEKEQLAQAQQKEVEGQAPQDETRRHAVEVLKKAEEHEKQRKATGLQAHQQNSSTGTNADSSVFKTGLDVGKEAPISMYSVRLAEEKLMEENDNKERKTRNMLRKKKEARDKTANRLRNLEDRKKNQQQQMVPLGHFHVPDNTAVAKLPPNAFMAAQSQPGNSKALSEIPLNLEQAAKDSAAAEKAMAEVGEQQEKENGNDVAEFESKVDALEKELDSDISMFDNEDF